MAEASKPRAAPAAVYCAADGRELTEDEIKALTPEQRWAAGKRGERNQGIKEGRQRATAEILNKLGVQRLEDASEIARLTAERDARPTREEELKHGRHQRWMGGFWGFAIGMIASTVIILTMQGVIWATAANSFREQAMTGALLQSQERDERNNEPSYDGSN